MLIISLIQLHILHLSDTIYPAFIPLVLVPAIAASGFTWRPESAKPGMRRKRYSFELGWASYCCCLSSVAATVLSRASPGLRLLRQARD